MDSVLASISVVALIASLAAAGCAAEARLLDSKQDKAIETALVRGKLEMNCDKSTGTILSKKVTQPVKYGPRAGIERAEFSIGVKG